MIEPAVITAPTKEPVSLQEVYDQLKLPVVVAEVANLELYIAAARRWFEARTGRTIHETEYEFTHSCFPSYGYIVLPRATPLISITSVKYVDSTGTVNTVSSSLYLADTYNTPGRVVLAYGQSWPSFTAHPVAPVRIRYKAGIPTSSPETECAEDIKLAITMLVGGYYENRESEVITDLRFTQDVAMRYGVEALIAKNIATYVF